MARSVKKTKIRGIVGTKSEKQCKRDANRKLRRIIRQKMKTEDSNLPKLREISNVWAFEKDGKSYYKDMTSKQI